MGLDASGKVYWIFEWTTIDGFFELSSIKFCKIKPEHTARPQKAQALLKMEWISISVPNMRSTARSTKAILSYFYLIVLL